MDILFDCRCSCNCSVRLRWVSVIYMAGSQNAFTIDNGGSIPSNVIIAPNTDSHSTYLIKCKEKGLPIHPARMPMQLPEFFIKMLTESGDIVLDCFAGSNTTGYCAEKLNRKWISVEANKDYYMGSKYRF